jgi:hypothetical protein
MKSGTRLGHYEIVSELGKGGMGPLGEPLPKGTVGPRLFDGAMSETTSPVPERGEQR